MQMGKRGFGEGFSGGKWLERGKELKNLLNDCYIVKSHIISISIQE